MVSETGEKRREKFLKDCELTPEIIEEFWYTVTELMSIYDNHKKRSWEYKELWVYITQIFLQKPHIFHSIKFRVKDPKSLIYKILKKKWVTLNNYTEEIDDLLWVRALIIDKKNRKDIHKFIVDKWELKEKIAYFVNENDEISYKKDFYPKEIKKSGRWYSSLHYIIKTKPTIQAVSVEIQVRSLLEEAWWEVDHLLRYKKDLDNQKWPTIGVWLNILNSFVIKWNELVSFLFEVYHKGVLMKDIQKMKILIKESTLPESEKEELYKELYSFLGLGGFISKDISSLTERFLKLRDDYQKVFWPVLQDIIKQQQYIKDTIGKIQTIPNIEYGRNNKEYK